MHIYLFLRSKSQVPLKSPRVSPNNRVRSIVGPAHYRPRKRGSAPRVANPSAAAPNYCTMPGSNLAF
jgi:hypothetical protein